MPKPRKPKQTSLHDTLLYDQITQLETSILVKLSLLRKSHHHPPCPHFLNLQPEPQHYEPRENYYEKFWRLFLEMQVCRERIQGYEEVLGVWEAEIGKIQVRCTITYYRVLLRSWKKYEARNQGTDPKYEEDRVILTRSTNARFPIATKVMERSLRYGCTRDRNMGSCLGKDLVSEMVIILSENGRFGVLSHYLNKLLLSLTHNIT